MAVAELPLPKRIALYVSLLVVGAFAVFGWYYARDNRDVIHRLPATCLSPTPTATSGGVTTTPAPPCIGASGPPGPAGPAGRPASSGTPVSPAPGAPGSRGARGRDGATVSPGSPSPSRTARPSPSGPPSSSPTATPTPRCTLYNPLTGKCQL